MASEKTNQRILIVLAAFHVTAAGLCWSLAGRLFSTSLWALAVVNVGAAATALLAAAYDGLWRLAADEAAERARTEPAGGRLFDDGAEALDRARSLKQFERIALPCGTLAILGGEGVLTWMLRAQLAKTSVPSGPLVAGVTALALALGFFLISRYAAALASSGDGRRALLRAPAASACVVAAACFGTGVVSFLTHFLRDVESALLMSADRAVAWGILAVIVLGIAERIINLIWSVYRPKRPGEANVPVYESRLASALVQPGGFAANLADVLDYQFGFQVSETWFSRLIRRTVVPLALMQVGILVTLSCLVFVNPGEEVLVERWGRPAATNLGPGLHVKWPWPIGRAYRFKASRVMRFTIGDAPAPETDGKVRPELWGGLSADAPLFVVAEEPTDRAGGAEGNRAPPAGLLASQVSVFYKLKSIRDFDLKHADAVAVLEKLLRREAVAYFASHDGDALLQHDRADIAQTIRGRLQELADSLSLGIDVLSVGLVRLQPPPAVVPAYHETLQARQERETALLEAERYRYETLPAAQGEADELVSKAMAERAGRLAAAQAFVDVYSDRHAAYRAYPRFFYTFSYLERLEEAMKDARKIVVASDVEGQQLNVDLRSDTKSDLLDVAMPGIVGGSND